VFLFIIKFVLLNGHAILCQQICYLYFVTDTKNLIPIVWIMVHYSAMFFCMIPKSIFPNSFDITPFYWSTPFVYSKTLRVAGLVPNPPSG